MSHLFGQIGMGIDADRAARIVIGLAFAAVALVFWLVVFVGSGGRGPKVPRVGRLPRIIGPVLAVVAVGLWGVCGWADAAGDRDRSRVLLPYAVAATVAAVSVLGPAIRRPGRCPSSGS